ncbi:MAG TPA: hypothetical protein VGG40_00890 [Solirubrobacterales bacterium]|jgi:DNA-binding transcriptional ArsR family regulator
MVAGVGSATSLSKLIHDASVGDLYYHLTVLERCRVVDFRQVSQVRGSKERIYELRSAAAWGDVWGSLPPLAAAGLRNAWLGEFASLAAAALDSRTIEGHLGSVFGGRLLRVDEQGAAEIRETLRAALASVERIEAQSRGRLEAANPAGGTSMVVGAAAFEAPPAQWWEGRNANAP